MGLWDIAKKAFDIATELTDSKIARDLDSDDPRASEYAGHMIQKYYSWLGRASLEEMKQGLNSGKYIIRTDKEGNDSREMELREMISRFEAAHQGEVRSTKVKSNQSRNAQRKEKKSSEATSSQLEYNNSFEMVINNIFLKTGKGLVVIGTVRSGLIKAGDKVFVTRSNNHTEHEAEVSEIELDRKQTDSAKKGDDIGILLKGIEKSRVRKGDIIIIRQQ